MAEYPAYRQDVIVGASLQVTALPGQYDSDKLLNVGTNRWSFKPELGVSKAWGSLIPELIPAVTFFTSNDHFLNGSRSSSTAARASTAAPTATSGRSGSPGNTAGVEGSSEERREVRRRRPMGP